MRLAFLFAETAQPTAADVVRAIAPERVMHLIDQTKRAPQVSPIADGALETEEIAHRERVGPKVATRRPVAGEPRAIGEASHQSLRGADGAHQAVFRSGAPGCNRICPETLRLTCGIGDSPRKFSLSVLRRMARLIGYATAAWSQWGRLVNSA